MKVEICCVFCGKTWMVMGLCCGDGICMGCLGKVSIGKTQIRCRTCSKSVMQSLMKMKQEIQYTSNVVMTPQKASSHKTHLDPEWPPSLNNKFTYATFDSIAQQNHPVSASRRDSWDYREGNSNSGRRYRPVELMGRAELLDYVYEEAVRRAEQGLLPKELGAYIPPQNKCIKAYTEGNYIYTQGTYPHKQLYGRYDRYGRSHSFIQKRKS